MSKKIGLVLIILGILDYFTAFAQCSSFMIWFYGACNILTVFFLVILGSAFLFYKTDESIFQTRNTKKKKKDT